MTFAFRISNLNINQIKIRPPVKVNKKLHLLSLKILFLLVFTASFSFAQSLTNLEQIFGLIDKSGKEIALSLNSQSKNIGLKYNCPAEYKILEQRIEFAFSRSSINFNKENSVDYSILNYNLDIAGINYKRVFKDGWFGNMLVERESFIRGTYVLENKGVFLLSEKFDYSVTDTIKKDDISSLENLSLPFTKDEIPPEPFFSGLLEPIIAVGTAVVTVILFFTVRSK